jgi:hypothetical protein
MVVATIIYYFLLLNISANGFYHGLIFLFIKIKKGNIDQDIAHVKLEYDIDTHRWNVCVRTGDPQR